MNPHEATGFNLHNSMFTDTVNRLASDEQKEKWLPLVQSFRMVGTYAQTELGHGKTCSQISFATRCKVLS